MDGEGEKGRLEAKLKEPDAILEPQILDTLRRYVMNGGQPQTVVAVLADNYAGYAPMASLLCDWLRTSNDDEDGEPSGDAEDHSEFAFLQKLAKDRFDLDKFAGVFSKGGSKPPKWLEGLAADPQGRQLIYDLSAEHKNCLLLNFAIQKILYQGHEQEVASVGTSLSGYFEVFHRLMITRLRAIAVADPSQLPAEVESLAKSCCQDHHSYAHLQMVVAELGRRDGGARFRRVAQEVEAYAAKEHGELVWRMQPAFMNMGTSPEHKKVAQLVGRLVGAEAAGGNVAGGDHSVVQELHDLYSQPSAPPAEPLRHPRCLKALTSALFTPDMHLPHTVISMYMHLLALAVAGIDTPKGLDRQDVDSCHYAIEAAFSVATNAMKGIKVDNDAMDVPAAAIGVLHFMELTLGEFDFYRSTSCIAAAPVFLKLLNQIATKHVTMRERVVEIISKALHAMGNSKPTLARNFLDLAVLLLSYGQMAVMAMANKWEKLADPSLVRHFVLKVLAVAAPPYSAEFSAWLLRLLVVGSFRKMRDAPRGSSEAFLLEEFAKICAGSRDTLGRPLSNREAAALKELSG